MAVDLCTDLHLQMPYCLFLYVYWQVAKMLTDYEWISSEKHLFGQPNTAYDFKTNNPKEAGQRLQKLQEKKEKLGRNVNMRAMNMLSEAEERVELLLFHAPPYAFCAAVNPRSFQHSVLQIWATSSTHSPPNGIQ